MTERLTYVEIDVPRCTLTYATAPCTARLGETGVDKCFNTRATCQDRANIAENDITIRFAVPTASLPKSIDCIPSIDGVDFSPGVVSLGTNIGQRASLKVTFRDHRDSDTGVWGDDYLSDRDYNPFDVGTFWGKFRARQPYMRGKSLRWISGRTDQSLSEMETRHFVVDDVAGPSVDGKFEIIAKDVLKLADDDRAQAPALSNGYLSGSLTSGGTSATLSPSGIGNAEYPASGYVCIGGREVCSFTRSSDTLTLTRAQFNTVAVAHSAQDRVQVALRYSSEDAADIIDDLLQTYAGIPSSYIPITDWQDETASFLGVVYTTTITEPTAVKDLISELIEQAALALWWDDINRKIRLQVLRGVSTDASTYSDAELLAGTLAPKDQAAKRLSRVQTYFAQIDPTKSLGDLDNYRSSAETVDDDAETDYGGVALKRVTSRWIPALGRSTAEKLNQKLLSRYRDPPRLIEFSLLRNSLTVDPTLGGGYTLNSWVMQDAAGRPVDTPIQIVSIKVSEESHKVTAEEVLYTPSAEDLTERLIIIDVNTNNVNMRTAHDSLYPTPESGDKVTLRINSGIIVGSTSTGSPALNIGSWPSGVTITLQINGRIEGCGGSGGRGSDASSSNGSSGGAGGNAFYTRQAIDIEYGAGAEVWGGGGGGAGGGSLFGSPGGGGGGGGGGKNSGSVGADGAGSFITVPGAGGTTEAGGAGSIVSVGASGGAGGNPGSAGISTAAYSGGAAGSAIDGISYVTVTSGSGDIRGGTIN